MIDDVGTEVRDGTLRVTFDHDGFGVSDVVVEASAPKLTGIEASGSGDVRYHGDPALTQQVDGSGELIRAG